MKRGIAAVTAAVFLSAGLLSSGVYAMQPETQNPADTALMDEQYISALQAGVAGDYETAAETFGKLGEYRDSHLYSAYYEAMDLMERGNRASLIAALDIWLDLAGFLNSDAKRLETVEQLGMSIGQWEEESTEESTEAMTEEAAEDENLSEKSWEKTYRDLPVVSLEEAQIGDVFELGMYEQDGDRSNGPEPIKWRVYQTWDDGVRAVSEYALEVLPYNTNSVNLNWTESTLYRWMNGVFFSQAFSSSEQDMFFLTYSNTGTENMAESTVFIPGSATVEENFGGDVSPQAYATRYAKNSGAAVDEVSGSSRWWVRKSISSSGSASCIDYDGTAMENVSVYDLYGVRPCITVRRTPQKISIRIPEEPVKSAAADLKAGDLVRFGHYEQDADLGNGAEAIEWRVLAVEEGRILVISRYGLDARPYEAEYGSTDWENCSLREWLNGYFFETAFSEQEQRKIQLTQVVNETRGEDGADAGNDTQDHLFLLSYDESTSYFANITGKKAFATRFARGNGASVGERTGACWWWLRSPGSSTYRAATIRTDGGAHDSGDRVSHGTGAVRPAMWIDTAPVAVKDAQVGDLIEIGHYEQDGNPDNGPEPIKWRVLEDSDGDLRVVSEFVLEAMPYNEENTIVTWGDCKLRQWLNGSFLTEAFDDSEEEMILFTNVTTTDEEKTSDKVYILGGTGSFADNESRQAYPTPYAAEKWEGVDGSDETVCWWVRSHIDDSLTASIVDAGGGNEDSCPVTDLGGVRPAMWIRPK